MSANLRRQIFERFRRQGQSALPRPVPLSPQAPTLSPQAPTLLVAPSAAEGLHFAPTPVLRHILASRSRTLYVGVTNNLARRLAEHRSGQVDFTRRYSVHRLVLAESTTDIRAAIALEKQIKR